MKQGDIMEEYLLKDVLIEEAEDQMKKYPQYKGGFNNTILVKVKKLQKTKLGVAFDKDEITIAEPGMNKFVDIKGKEHISMTLWSFKNKCWTSINYKIVEIV